MNYVHKYDNLDEMGQFLKHNQLKLTEEETDSLTRPTSIKINEQTATSPDVFSGEFYQICKEEIITYMHQASLVAQTVKNSPAIRETRV